MNNFLNTTASFAIGTLVAAGAILLIIGLMRAGMPDRPQVEAKLEIIPTDTGRTCYYYKSSLD